MQQNPHSFATAIPSESPDSPTVWEFIGLHDIALLWLSFVLLIFSTVDPGPFGSIVKICWLALFAALALVNVGAALAAYIGSLAIYSSLLFPGGSSLLQRPDNLAVVILFLAMLLQILKRHDTIPRSALYIPAFLFFCSVHLIFSSPTQFPALIRDVVIPLLACTLSAIIGYRKKELDALFNGLAILGGYMGFVSILERIPGATQWILPQWIAYPSLRPYDEFLVDWIGSGRSGGTLLQPAFNGLLLSLILMLLIFQMRTNDSGLLKVPMALCIAGSFFTYTRGVWLGLIVSVLFFPGWCRNPRQANVRRIALACFATVFLIAASGFASERLQDGGTILYRLNLWGAGFRIFLSHPLLGVGFFNFGTALGGAEQGFGSLFPSFRDVEEGVASHNTLLTVLVEFGLIGFVLFCVTIYQIVKGAKDGAIRLVGSPGRTWVIAFVLLYLVNAQFISAFEGTTNTTFFALLGVIAGAQTMTTNDASYDRPAAA
jgi:O-antigen ligase